MPIIVTPRIPRDYSSKRTHVLAAAKLRRCNEILLTLVCVVSLAGCAKPTTTAIAGCGGMTGAAAINCMADSKINDTQSPQITTFSLQVNKLPYSEAKNLGSKLKVLPPPEKPNDKKP
jgi:hypothetical protein